MAANQSKTGLARFLLTLAIIGAINWGLIGFFNWNLVDALFGGGAAEQTSTFSRIIYALVGLAGLGALAFLPRLRDVNPESSSSTSRTGVGRRAEVRP